MSMMDMSKNTIKKYVRLGKLIEHRHITGTTFFYGVDILNFCNNKIY